MFPSTDNVDDKGDKASVKKGGESSAAAVNPSSPLHEQRGMARSATHVKRGRKTPTNAIGALSIQERQPRNPTEDYGPYPIVEETPDFHA